MNRALLTIVMLTATASTALAHEFWIQPSSFATPADTVLRLGLHVGDGFPGHPVIRDRAAFKRFVIAGPLGTEPVPGWDGRHPAGLTRVKSDGAHVIGYESEPTRIELNAAKFESYLREDGLERIIESRAERGESTSPGREAYRRCAKSIVIVGGDDTGFDRVLDLPLELVPEESPARDDGDKTMSFRLLHEGQPCAGVMVGARHRERPDHFVGARTDEDGRVTLVIDEPGPWLVSGVHMVAAPRDQDPDADVDWHSFWASLSFER